MTTAKRVARKAKNLAKTAVGADHSLSHLIHAIKNDIVGKIDSLQVEANSGFTSISEENSVLGMTMGRSVALSESTVELGQANNAELLALRFELSQLRSSLSELAATEYLKSLTSRRARISDIDENTAYFLNYAGSHNGPLADRNLWINDPVIIEWNKGNASVGAVNERIMEIPFVIQSLASLPPSARVLDVGGSESTVALSLASLGYQTTIVDPQGYPFEHPNLEVLLHPLEELQTTEEFDAVIFLSAVEHFGLGHYAGSPERSENADKAAIDFAKNLLTPGGLLALTVPYGPAETNDLERIYDLERLTALLSGWEILDSRVGRRLDSTTWSIESASLVGPAGPNRVAMVMATPKS